MDSDSNTEAWSQLVSVTDLETTAVPISKNKFIIGRNNDCDLPHPGNKLVSGRHCYLERDDSGKVWLYDTSTNGTLLNLSNKLSKGECRELHHGDEIYIVHKKDRPEDDIGYMFQDMEALRAETSSDTEDTQDATQVMGDADATLIDDDAVAADIQNSGTKRKSDSTASVDVKRVKKDTQVEVTMSNDRGGEKSDQVTTADNDTNTEVFAGEEKASTDGKDISENKDIVENQVNAETKKPSQEPEEDAIAETLVCIICQELLHDCISLQPCMHSFCAGCYSEWMERSNECPSCRLKVERINKNHIVNNLVEAYLKNKPEKRRPEADLKELDAKNKITRDMLYPAHKRKHSDSDNSDSGDYSDEDDDDGGRGGGGVAAGGTGFGFNFQGGGVVFGLGTPFFGAVNRPARPVCRQCPNYNTNQAGGGGLGGIVQGAIQGVRNLIGVGNANNNNTAGTGSTATTTGGANTAATTAAATTAAAQAGPSTGAGPSDSDTPAADPDAKTFPQAPNFTCAINNNHVLCLCCMQPMPDRRNQYTQMGTIPPQQCFLCYRSFCHAYWGCQNVGCNGCLAKFKDLNFGKKCLTYLILDNAYESEVFKNYLETKGLSVKDVFADCVAKMVTGEYPSAEKVRISAQNGINTPVCYACGLRVFKELAYYYRKDIPNDELPKEVTSRSNCYWGKNCRTQRNKPEHARRFNHICDQTRTA